METRLAARARPAEPAAVKRPFAGGLGFDWAMVVLCSWVLVGGCLDARAHLHGLVETFFTPWHAVLYAGFLAVASLSQRNTLASSSARRLNPRQAPMRLSWLRPGAKPQHSWMVRCSIGRETHG